MARDTYHDAVRAALEAEGWTITHDPYMVSAGTRNLRIDLGAERLIAAEKAGETIAVEVKSFVGISSLHEFYKAVGQFDYYKFSLAKQDAERILFLAVPFDFFEEFVEEDVHNQAYIADRHIRIIVYSPDTATLLKWIK
jgi:hypothetical protein